MSEDQGKDYTLESDSELRFEIEQKDAKVLVSVSSAKTFLDYNKFVIYNQIVDFSWSVDLRSCSARSW